MNSYEANIQALAETTLGKPLSEIRREMDYLHGVADKTLSTRIEAFGAIRRAAEVAREYDRIYRKAVGADDYGTFGYTPDGDDVRRAIRAAIGSEKA